MANKLSHPEIFIEETSAEIKLVAGVATGVTAFVGRTAKGPAGKAVLCLSYAEFVEKFGGAHPQSELADSVELFFKNGGSICYVVRVTLRTLRSEAILISKGFQALDKVDILNLMILPPDADIAGAHYSLILAAASEYCLEKRAFLLIDAPEIWKSGITKTIVDGFCAGIVKSSSAIFYPRVTAYEAGKTKVLGAAGAIAGLIARTDTWHGIWKAPSGSEAGLRGVADVEIVLTDTEIGRLSQLGINCLRKFPDEIVNYGARTLDGAEGLASEWKYINVRRLGLFLEGSIYRGTQWAVFEPNDVPLWTQVRSSIDVFMIDLWRRGAFQGDKPERAFYVRCGLNSTMTQNDIDNGILNIEIGFAPLRPAEFVTIYIQQIGLAAS
jgi:hypothetical protein